jgi:hypothetical protein
VKAEMQSIAAADRPRPTHQDFYGSFSTPARVFDEKLRQTTQYNYAIA